MLFDDTIDVQIDTGEISDGYHTFNELYDHRAVLFSVICNQNFDIAWKSKLHDDGTMYDGMFIAGISTCNGDIRYHVENKYWDLFRVKELDRAPEYDGHTSDDVLERLKWFGHADRRISDRIKSSFEYLKYKILGDDYYVVGPINGETVYDIMSADIVGKYKSLENDYKVKKIILNITLIVLFLTLFIPYILIPISL